MKVFEYNWMVAKVSMGTVANGKRKFDIGQASELERILPLSEEDALKLVNKWNSQNFSDKVVWVYWI